MKTLLKELIKEAKKILEEEYFEGMKGLCLHFHWKLQFFPDYEKNGGNIHEPFAYTLFYFYQSLVDCEMHLGVDGQFNQERIHYLNWIINEFPSLQKEFRIYKEKNRGFFDL